MFQRITHKSALALVVPAVAALGFAGSAAANPNAPSKVSFSASNDGASAGWSDGAHSPIDLTLGSTSGSFAMVSLHTSATAVSRLAEPTFSTDNYSAGSPRYYLTLSDGDTLWGYPSNSRLNGSDFAWAIDNHNSYMSWTAVQAAEGKAKVTGASVIADADQSSGTTDSITGLTFDGVAYN